eukprot:4302884-Amphidinium_carterae.1
MICWTCGGCGHQSKACPSIQRKVNEVTSPDKATDRDSNPLWSLTQGINRNIIVRAAGGHILRHYGEKLVYLKSEKGIPTIEFSPKKGCTCSKESAVIPLTCTGGTCVLPLMMTRVVDEELERHCWKNGL